MEIEIYVGGEWRLVSIRNARDLEYYRPFGFRVVRGLEEGRSEFFGPGSIPSV